MSGEPITFEEFQRQLKVADWLHPLSDDGREFRRGMEQCERLKHLAIAKGGEWQEAYKAASSEAWARVHR